MNGITITPYTIECKHCGYTDEFEPKFLASNRAVQMLCRNCGAWNGNYRYATAERYIMPFGKYKGEFVCELPDEYLTWLYENLELKGGLLDAVEAALRN